MKNRESLIWIKNKSKKHIMKIFVLSIANIILAFIGTALPLLSRYAIDAADVFGKKEFVEYRNIILRIGIAILGTILLRMFLRICTQSMSVKVQAGMEMDMRSNLFGQIIKKNYCDITKYHSGELMNRMTSDIKIVTEGITMIVPNLLFLVFQLLGALIVLISFDWKFTIIFLGAAIVLALVTLVFRKRLKSLHKAVQETDGKVRSFYQEAIESLLVVKTFGVEERFVEKGDELQNTNYQMKMKRKNISIFANTGFSFIFNAGYLFALVWCTLKVGAKAMSYGTLTAMLQLISQIQMPMFNVTKIIPQYYSVLASAERIMEIEQITEEKNDGQMIDVPKFYETFEKGAFENIKFNYGRETVLEEGNAVFYKGDFVAIRGISGIGKSTLFKLLLGVFSPNEGQICLYQENGNAIQASPETRKLFTYVPQGNYLFSGTLRENITLVREATEKEIENALKVSEIDAFVQTLPQGLDTVIGENGAGLSEGQAQRIAIARAILSEAPILLLDEATSALDEATEKKVLNNIKNLKNRTCIIITHKKAALEVCNKEFVIRDKKMTCES